ncbi:MAG: hypothetical protein HY996_02415 [Micrococcales bacterium]|nr:hypothetical protein [Micrococcales bacterium]
MTLTAAPADQALLLDLQILDTTLQRLATRRAKLPESAVVAEVTADRTQSERLVVEQTGAVEDARAELRRTEADVAVVDARIARDQQRLQNSSSMKDIQGLEQELQALARRKSDLEDIELVVMERVEEREGALAATREALAGLATRHAEAVAARDAALGALERDRAQAVRERDEIVGRLPADLVALYEKQRARYGVGASLLRGGVSTAVGVALGVADLRAVAQAAPEDVLICPESSAILVRTEESGI